MAQKVLPIYHCLYIAKIHLIGYILLLNHYLVNFYNSWITLRTIGYSGPKFGFNL